LAITVSETEATRAKIFLENRGSVLGLRLGVKTTGCSRLAYILQLIDEVNVDEQLFDDNGVKIITDCKRLAYLDGTHLDFAKDGLNEGFQFTNPNANG
jgi:iron-sulfur cluster assembly protein